MRAYINCRLHYFAVLRPWWLSTKGLTKRVAGIIFYYLHLWLNVSYW